MSEKKPFDGSINAFTSVPIEVTISVGKARPTVRELLNLGPQSVLTLDRKIDDPVELYAGSRLIAKGELIDTEDGDGKLSVRLTEVADLQGTLGSG